MTTASSFYGALFSEFSCIFRVKSPQIIPSLKDDLDQLKITGH